MDMHAYVDSVNFKVMYEVHTKEYPVSASSNTDKMDCSLLLWDSGTYVCMYVYKCNSIGGS